MPAPSLHAEPANPSPSAAGPVVVELDPGTRPEAAFRALAGEPHAVFFDSAQRHERLGRYSYVAADPFDWFTGSPDEPDVLQQLRQRLGRWIVEPTSGLPPWQGGAAGLIGYEIGRGLERLPRPRWDEFQTPALAMGLYDTVVAFDHLQQRAWAVSQGLPAEGDARRRRAEQRVAWLLDRLDGGPSPQGERHAPAPLSQPSLAPQFATRFDGVLSDFAREDYLRAVERVVDHLRAGDAFQVNLSQRLLLEDPGDPVAMYLRLRERNPAPFGGYLDGGDWQVASASPERFLRLQDGLVETRPIKGTRPLSGVAEELLASEKDRAENVMIVDLLRNDLSRVCEDDSIDVPELFAVERYAHVQHLVSAVTGRLRRDRDATDLLAATLPGGSITGAPKVRAQEIIARLEPTARGAYCGSLAWIGFPDGQGRQAMDSSVLIRTLTRARGWIQAPVGSGVVVQSDPEAEYEETWHKAAGLIEPVTP
ncbi:Aminodeoxychorismate synthase component 1 [Planctomycetes bacterium MalM25]|nr:Aminodeoxychorismate synthase component 1 [Planctomycetes bacterium MalM25]